jgi:hypothetical protein
MCVVHAHHAAEILLKARIAQEHPLLIFSKLPKPESNEGSLTLIDLLEKGRTFSYQELPNQLWATTGIKIENNTQYEEFGRLRNQIIHFSKANFERLDILTLRYSLELLDPLVEGFWGRSVIDFIRNDPYGEYSSHLSSGMLEDSIRRVCKIDQRLRRILGENSKKAWTTMVEMNSYHESQEELEARYQDWLDLGGDDGRMEGFEKNIARWEEFLASF